MEIGEKILMLRKNAGMTQDELARELFITRQSIYKWETGRSVPDIDKIRQLCKLFNVSADELLGIPVIKPTGLPDISLQPSEKIDECQETVPKNKHFRSLWLILPVIILVTLMIVIFYLCRPSYEVRQAAELGIVPTELQIDLSGSISEKDFLHMLLCASGLQQGADVEGALYIAYNTATKEQLTREKAAYWLYAAHIWTVLEPEADLSLGHAEGDMIAQRDVYQDLNNISQTSVEIMEAPWEWSLCTELKETGQLFDIYDGSSEMDNQINSILYGPYYTAVTFCTVQKSYIDNHPVLECRDGIFRAKERITGREAVTAVYRLYGAW